MNDLNTVILEGNLTRDPKITVYPDNSLLCAFTIATNRYIKKKGADNFKQATSYFSVEAWGEMAHSYADELKKGRGVRVVGKLRQTTWHEESMFREKVYIVAEHIEIKTQYKKYNPEEEQMNKEADSVSSIPSNAESAEIDTTVDEPVEESPNSVEENKEEDEI